MPRPGPRPYECVRRAWHSDRHEPMRGSLIQEIFRLANEFHNSTTRKNKEWLEKLPLVVLKAEEIMYSKANSEAEYMDLKTLWDRANNAIDTIILKDDSPETEGDLLQPCIEAALNLRCIPRRASRSQRHPESYLSSINKETPHLSASMQLLYSCFASANKLNHFSNEVHYIAANGSFELKDSVGTYNCASLGRVYPLHYSDTQLSFSSNGVNFLHDFIGSNNASGSLNKNSTFEDGFEKTPASECDLSLRLGISRSNFDEETAWTWADDVGSSCSSNRD